MWERGNRAGLIPFDEERVHLTRQYRFLANRVTLKIPEEKEEKGEKLKQAAIRECKEETDFHCFKVKKN
jgi:hypothetical protein